MLGCMKANMKIQFKKSVAVSNMCNCLNAIVFYSDFPNKHHMDVDNSSMIQNIDNFFFDKYILLKKFQKAR